MEHPLSPPHSLERPAPAPAPFPLQPTLVGLDSGLVAAPVPAPAGRAAPVRLKGRRRYWSIRDLSRRLWLGRGYELLRELVRSGVLPATRSARSWWIEDAHAASLRLAFDERAGQRRAFRALDGWLRERCWVVPADAATLALSAPDGPLAGDAGADAPAAPAIFHWRGTAYLPRTHWRAESAPAGGLVYRHRSGVALAAPAAGVAA